MSNIEWTTKTWNPTSDLFHESVTFQRKLQIFKAIKQTPQHTYQVLTKRPERMGNFMRDFVETFGLLPNLWLGVTVENQKAADERIPLLLQTPAAVRFLSCEPLLGPIALNLQGLHWCIVGGESGLGARPCDIAWIRGVVEQCKDAKVPCFVKQLGSRPIETKKGQVLVGEDFIPPDLIFAYPATGKGTNPDEWPEHLKVRQFPAIAGGAA